MMDFFVGSSLYTKRAAVGKAGRGVTSQGRAPLADGLVERSVASQAEIAADWLEAVAGRRDQAAFADLFRYYAPRIKTYLRRLGAEDGVAEELAQDAMLQVWRKSALFDRRRAAASTWIFAIARNLRIDRLRAERRPEIDSDDPFLTADPAIPADEILIREARDQTLRRLLKSLPAEQEMVVTLSFFEDIPHSEIALRLGLPLGTVKSRLRLAMQRIRGHLEEMT
jgi:RNA polymerase sigma-70 factor (ECF subfamily)